MTEERLIALAGDVLYCFLGAVGHGIDRSYSTKP